MIRRVVLTGIGSLTPIGHTAEEACDAVLKGKSGTARVTQVDPQYFSSKVAAEVKDFEPLKYLSAKQLKKTDRFVQFAVAGSKMAFEDSALDVSKEDVNFFGVLIGSGIGGLRTIEE